MKHYRKGFIDNSSEFSTFSGFDLWFSHVRNVFVEVTVSELVWKLYRLFDLSSSTNKTVFEVLSISRMCGPAV